MEELVRGPGQCVANAHSRCDDAGAQPQVRHFTQALQSTSWRVSKGSRAV